LLEQAHGGTLFLDEIGEMPLATQPKLLRVLEDLRVRRLGGKREIEVDARVLAATSQELGTHLREELYYRLSVFQIIVPPLREHKEDIPPISEVMLQNLNKKYGTRVTGVDSEAMDVLHRYDWPGNVRELRNILERATIMAGEGVIELGDLPSPAFDAAPNPYARPAPSREPSNPPTGQPLLKLEDAYIKLTSITCRAIANAPPRCWKSACAHCRTASPHCAKKRDDNSPAPEQGDTSVSRASML